MNSKKIQSMVSVVLLILVVALAVLVWRLDKQIDQLMISFDNMIIDLEKINEIVD